MKEHLLKLSHCDAMIFYGSLAMHPWTDEPDAGETDMLEKTTPLLVQGNFQLCLGTGEIRSWGLSAKNDGKTMIKQKQFQCCAFDFGCRD